MKSSRKIDAIVLHCTDGGAVDARQTARNVFAQPPEIVNGKARSQSSHYIVGRDGTVVHCVRHKDIAYHANNENASTIGIEHKHDFPPIRRSLASSIGGRRSWSYGLASNWAFRWTDGAHRGHSEIDTTTTHQPAAGPRLGYYMHAISDLQGAAEGRVSMTLGNWE